MGARMLVQVWKVAPALAAGNAVILKPSEYASVTSLELGAIAGEPYGRAVQELDYIEHILHWEHHFGASSDMLVGCHAEAVRLPAGVLNVVTGLGGDAGAPLSGHPGVNKISFTGSVETGRRVNLAAAANLRPTSMVQHDHCLLLYPLPSIPGVCIAAPVSCRQATRHCQNNWAPALQELGGKSALIVFEDADVDKAVEWAMVRPHGGLSLRMCCD
jgi:betaine-aldehyde dehydrogenase